MMKSRFHADLLINSVFFALSCLYLVAEFRFNITLLDVAGSARVDTHVIHSVADFGRTVSGFGFTLLALGIFSRTRFRLIDRRAQVTFAVFALLCFAPFVLTPPAQQEMLFIVPVAFGAFLMLASRGQFPFHTVLSIVLMAWPAMFAGQKAMMEHVVVAPTTWQERQHARDVLMLKAGLENCVVEVADQWLCKGDKSTAEVRAVRTMIAALWMHSPAAVIQAIAPQKDNIIDKAARQNGNDVSIQAYQKYVGVVKAERDKMVDDLIKRLYTPYQRASKAYMTAKNPQKLAADVDKIWREMEYETDTAWNEYLDAQRRYRQTVGQVSDTMLTRSGVLFEKLDQFCATRNCPRGNADRATLRLMDEAETRFIRQTGFPPNVTSKAELMSYPRARDSFEQQTEQRLAKVTGFTDARLPANWVYDEAYLKTLLTEMFKNRVFTQWRITFGDLPAGIPVDEFFVRMNVPPVPALEQLVMSEKVFAETHTLPQLREKMRGTLDQLKREAPLYANGEALEAKGKDYIRAVYIPAVALLTSLFIVILTVARGLNALLRLAMQALHHSNVRGGRHLSGLWQRHLRHAIMATVFGVIALGPFMLNNNYTQARVYQVYVAHAQQENIVTATLLDWAIHMQPIVYGAVRPFLKD